MSRTNIILLVVGILLVLAAGYMLTREDTSPAISVSEGPATEAELIFLNLTAQIEPVAFDTSILSDERFMALMDIRTAILPEPPGRLDPFGPLGGAPVAE